MAGMLSEIAANAMRFSPHDKSGAPLTGAQELLKARNITGYGEFTPEQIVIQAETRKRRGLPIKNEDIENIQVLIDSWGLEGSPTVDDEKFREALVARLEALKTPVAPTAPETTKAPETETARGLINQAHEILLAMEGEERVGQEDYNQKDGQIKRLIKQAKSLAGTNKAENRLVDGFAAEFEARTELLWTWVKAIVPSTLSEKRDYKDLPVSKDLKINTRNIGTLIAGNKPGLDESDTTFSFVNEKVGPTEKIIKFDNPDLGEKKVLITPVGNVLRYLDDVYKGKKEIYIVSGGSGQRELITGENVHENIPALKEEMRKDSIIGAYDEETREIAFRISWTILMHQSYFMSKSRPRISDRFYMLWHYHRYAKAYAQADKDAFMSELIDPLFGEYVPKDTGRTPINRELVRKGATETSTEIAKHIEAGHLGGEVFGVNRKKLKNKLARLQSENDKFSGYGWLAKLPLVLLSELHVAKDGEPTSTGYDFAPFLAWATESYDPADTKKVRDFFEYQDKDGNLIYEAMPWFSPTVNSDLFYTYISKLKTGPGPFADKVLYENPLTVTGGMTDINTYANWIKMLEYVTPLMRGVMRLSQEARKVVQRRIQFIMVVAAIEYRAKRVTDSKQRWGVTDVINVLKAAEKSKFITHTDVELIWKCFMPFFEIITEELVETTLHEITKG